MINVQNYLQNNDVRALAAPTLSFPALAVICWEPYRLLMRLVRAVIDTLQSTRQRPHTLGTTIACTWCDLARRALVLGGGQ